MTITRSKTQSSTPKLEVDFLYSSIHMSAAQKKKLHNRTLSIMKQTPEKLFMNSEIDDLDQSGKDNQLIITQFYDPGDSFYIDIQQQSPTSLQFFTERPIAWSEACKEFYLRLFKNGKSTEPPNCHTFPNMDMEILVCPQGDCVPVNVDQIKIHINPKGKVLITGDKIQHWAVTDFPEIRELLLTLYSDQGATQVCGKTLQMTVTSSQNHNANGIVQSQINCNTAFDVSQSLFSTQDNASQPQNNVNGNAHIGLDESSPLSTGATRSTIGTPVSAQDQNFTTGNMLAGQLAPGSNDNSQQQRTPGKTGTPSPVISSLNDLLNTCSPIHHNLYSSEDANCSSAHLQTILHDSSIFYQNTSMTLEHRLCFAQQELLLALREVDHLRQLNKDLNDEVNGYTIKDASIQSELKNLKEKHKVLSRDLAKKINRCDELMKENVTLNKKCESLEGKNSKLDEENMSARDEVNILQSKLNSLIDPADTHPTAKLPECRVNDNAKTTSVVSAQNRSALQAHVKRLEKQFADKCEELNIAKAKITTMQSKSTGQAQVAAAVNSEGYAAGQNRPIPVVVSRSMPGLTSKAPTKQPQRMQSRPKLAIIGSSNMKGMAYRCKEYGVDATAYCYSSARIESISDRLDKIFHINEKPEYLMMHTMDIDTMSLEPIPVIKEKIKALFERACSLYPDTGILVSGLPCNSYLPHVLQQRSSELNSFASQLCVKHPNLAFLDNSDLHVRRDNLHLTMRAKDILARKVAHKLKNVFPLDRVTQQV